MKPKIDASSTQYFVSSCFSRNEKRIRNVPAKQSRTPSTFWLEQSVFRTTLRYTEEQEVNVRRSKAIEDRQESKRFTINKIKAEKIMEKGLFFWFYNLGKLMTALSMKSRKSTLLKVVRKPNSFRDWTTFTAVHLRRHVENYPNFWSEEEVVGWIPVDWNMSTKGVSIGTCCSSLLSEKARKDHNSCTWESLWWRPISGMAPCDLCIKDVSGWAKVLQHWAWSPSNCLCGKTFEALLFFRTFELETDRSLSSGTQYLFEQGTLKIRIKKNHKVGNFAFGLWFWD